MMNATQEIILQEQPVPVLVPDQIQIPVQSAVQPTKNPLTPTIFHEHWWLDIVTGGDYDVAQTREHGQVVGLLYYFLRRRRGMTYSLMPPLTHFLGPAVVDDNAESPSFTRRMEIICDLLRQLPRASIYRYKCHRDITDSIAFDQVGFHTSAQFTYEILPDKEEVLWNNLRSKKQRLRSAQKEVSIDIINDPLRFWLFYDLNWQGKGGPNIIDQRMCCQLIEACLNRDRGRIYGAFNHKRELVAAALFVWDDTSCYYFLSSRTADAHCGATSLLVWEGIKEAARRGLIFDFDGLSNSNSVLFFTQFGGIVCPRLIVTRHSFLGGIALGLKNLRRESRYFY